ncbi:phosphonatase-like hydrolase [Prauserella cavernicola]|uniref:Phosphonatase-like hydrolase n=1 Tax=Prauserella cavernicola TaxID=2800127 RepID=A0A934QRH1_9PSEU|nr:phosphonatase-like hydrolase [Prauserella cavernicola]MBK1784803.1 phosphonatase-like hydrolase [Prauserella cavernicola]
MIELAVLDIAGTTVEEHGAVYAALEQAATAAGGTPTAADVRRWMGAGKREAITGLVTETTGRAPTAEVVEQGLTDFRARLADAYAATPPTPLPGVPEAITALRGAGVRVALTTGFDRQVVSGLLETLGWDDSVVDAVVSVDDVSAGRPAPYLIFRAMERTGVRDVRSVLTAGDTTRDLEAGSNAGAGYVVGVLTGGHSATDLGAARHTHMLPSVAAIPALLGI